MDNQAQHTLLYHFCRLRLPALALSYPTFERHVQRALGLYNAHRAREGVPASWDHFLANLYAVDWFLSCACLERDGRAWEILFGLRASRVDSLLVDALRAREVRLFLGHEERQENAIADLWAYLLAVQTHRCRSTLS